MTGALLVLLKPLVHKGAMMRKKWKYYVESIKNPGTGIQSRFE